MQNILFREYIMEYSRDYTLGNTSGKKIIIRELWCPDVGRTWKLVQYILLPARNIIPHKVGEKFSPEVAQLSLSLFILERNPHFRLRP